ncbi:MAG: MBL fold metallo-hydrolase, partial [Thermomicrobiaceae bacterium]|nr:MBL fold metallo-hydrolase [Thermomicrobiaceae bacterium]
MFFQQIVRSDIGCAAYLIGSTERGEAAVVDPRLDMVEEVLALADREGLRVRYVIETHNHADHVSGHHALAERTGATIATHALAGAAYPHRALQDGDEIALGEVRLRVIHTPGHRPEHIALAVIDDARGPDPWLVLSGDSLFVGDVARPDLAVDGREGAVALYHSLHDRLLALPDGTLVYPGHVSGSLCGRVTSRMSGTTIGFERRFNPALTIASVEEFVRYMNESLPQRPPNMARIVEVNRGAAPLAPASPRPIGVEDVLRWRDDGAWLLDVRPVDAFAAGHLPGSIAVPLGGSQFQNRVGLA